MKVPGCYVLEFETRNSEIEFQQMMIFSQILFLVIRWVFLISNHLDKYAA